MLTERWISREVPDFEGVLCASGEALEVKGSCLLKSNTTPELGRWLSVAVAREMELWGGKYRVLCGEALKHGSIGSIVLEAADTRAPIWSFISMTSNPFDQIVVKAGWVLVLSTSGAVFRFRPPLDDACIFIP